MNIERYIQYKSGQTITLRKETIHNGGVNMNARIQELQKKLSENMSKAVLFAEKNTVRNKQGYVVLKQDDEWRKDDEWDK